MENNPVSLQEMLIARRQKYIRVTEALDIVRNYDFEDFEMAVGTERFDAVMMAKREMGSQVHELCDLYHQSRMREEPFNLESVLVKPYMEDSLKRFQLYRDWADKNIERIICSEQKVHSDKYAYRGTLDVIPIFKGDGSPSITDIKTPVGKNKKWGWQVSAYEKAYMESMGMTGSWRRAVIRITDEVRVLDFPAKSDYTYFLYCLELAKEIKK
jgi:hypothetical protein